MATIRDVASQAGVAISTVSAVINRSAPVSEDVIARVHAAIASTGYLPNSAAKALRSGDSRLIGVIIPDIGNPHFSTVARLIEATCLSAGYMTFIYNTDEDADHEMRILKMMRMQRVDGMVLISTRSDAEHGRRLRAAINVPTVLLGSAIAELPFDTVTLDDEAASRLAIDYLVGLGHRRIAIIGGRKDVSTNEERLGSAFAALARHGIVPDPALVITANFKEEEALERTPALMQRPDPPTAIFSISNLMMIGVMRALARMGISSPRDVSLLCLGDFPWPEIMLPQMTVIQEPVVAMAECAIGTLLDEIASKRPPTGRRTLFQPRLILRGSCAPVPAIAVA